MAYDLLKITIYERCSIFYIYSIDIRVFLMLMLFMSFLFYGVAQHSKHTHHSWNKTNAIHNFALYIIFIFPVWVVAQKLSKELF